MAQREAERNWRLAESIVDTIRNPLIILEGDITIVTANQGFLSMFEVRAHNAIGRSLHALGQGQRQVGHLQELLARVVPDEATFYGFKIMNDFPGLRTSRQHPESR